MYRNLAIPVESIVAIFPVHRHTGEAMATKHCAIRGSWICWPLEPWINRPDSVRMKARSLSCTIDRTNFELRLAFSDGHVGG